MKILIVVDMQNDFIDGSLGSPEAQAIVPKVTAKSKEYKENNYHIVHTLDTHSENYLETLEGKNLPIKHCIYDTVGWRLNEEIAEYSEFCISKHTFGCASWKEVIGRWMQEEEIDEIELVGLCTDICVVSNALILKAFYPETKITVDASCCAGVTPEKHQAALEVMKSCQINVIGE